MKVIELNHISKKYMISHERKMLSKAILLGWLKRRKESVLWALKDIELEVNKGEVVGIIGENGSGKTTLLKILSGISAATTGIMKINGRVSSLLELGAGFHPDLTGRENIYLNGSLLGLKRKEIDRKFQEIVDFSGLQDFIDALLRTYSSGMYLRLGFSVAMSLSPDILLIDEVLSVGDETFQKECIKKIKEFKDSGKTIVFVSHDLDMVLNLCDKVFLLNYGKIIKSGNPADVVEFYLDMTGKKGVAILQKGALDVIFNQGKFSLYWQGKKITKGLGGFSSVFTGKQWYPSIQAEWEVKIREPDRLVFTGKWMRIPVIQIWEFNLGEQNSLKLRVTTECEQDLAIEQEQINVMLSDKYKEWLADGKKYAFPQIPSNCIAWEDLLLQESILNSVGVNYVQSEKFKFPSIYFCSLEKDLESTIKVFNTDYQNDARVLQYLNRNSINCRRSSGIELLFDLIDINNYLITEFEEKIKEIISCGSDLVCLLEDKPKLVWKDKELSQNCSLVKDYIENKLLEKRCREEKERRRQEEKKRQEEEVRLREIEKRTLQKDSLKLIFEDGSVRLFWKDTELTKGLGLYSSIYHAERWYLSSQVEWEAEKKHNKLIARGNSKYLPIEQIWEINMFPTEAISMEINMEINIDMIVRQRISVEQGVVGLMLPDNYKKWFTEKKQGNFIDIFGKEWIDILSIDPESEYGGVAEDKTNPSLPQVILKFNSKSDNNFVRITNTDFSYSSRVIQLLRFESQDKINFSIGRYPYFSFSVCIKS